MPRYASIAALLCLVACDPTDDTPPAAGGQFGEENGGGCVAVDSTSLADDEASIYGFTPQEIKDLIVDDHVAAIGWNDGSSGEITVSISAPGEASFVDYEYESDGTNSIEIGCEDTVEFDVTLAVVTDGGELDLEVSYTVRVGAEGAAVIWQDLDDFDASAWSAESFDETWASLNVAIGEDGLSGQIDGFGESTFGTGPDASVSLSTFEIATIGG